MEPGSDLVRRRVRQKGHAGTRANFRWNAWRADGRYLLRMRRARFYILVLGLTLLPQVLAASDLVRWLASQGQLALGFSVPGVLVALNLPMLAEVLRRKKKARLPRFIAASLQMPWTAWWLGSLFYAILCAGWTIAHLGPAPMPVALALAPYALSLYGTLFGARVLRREKVTVPVAGLPEGWRGARIVQLSDLHAGRHVTKERLRAIARRAARLDPDVLVVTGESIMAGYGLSWDESIPARVGLQLHMQSANMAVFGYATDQSYLRLK